MEKTFTGAAKTNRNLGLIKAFKLWLRRIKPNEYWGNPDNWSDNSVPTNLDGVVIGANTVVLDKTSTQQKFHSRNHSDRYRRI